MFRLPFEIFLAFRYFKPKRTYVSVITLIAIIGVTLAVGMLIIVISVMTGFDKELRDKILGFNSHLKIYAAGAPLKDYKQLMEKIKNYPGIKSSAPFILGQVLVETQPDSGNPLVIAPYVRGSDPRYESAVSIVPSNIISGSFDLEDKNVVIGKEMAQSLGITVGNHIGIYSPKNLQRLRMMRHQTNEVAVLPDDYVVAGIFDVGHFEYNSMIIITSIENAQELYNLDNEVHGLMVMVDNPFNAERIATELQRDLGGSYKVVSWMEEHSGILNALVVEKQAMFVVLFVIMIVAAFGITGTLIAYVFQKTREIGILKALGATNLQIGWLFFSQSVLVGVVGVIGGLIFGKTMLIYRNEFLHFMNRVTGIDLFPSSIYVFNELPALINVSDVAVICGSALFLCVLAGIIPALRAAMLHPVEALRYE
ncbi:MAG: ABC transporter permease [Verrucomicrobiia bacterium]